VEVINLEGLGSLINLQEKKNTKKMETIDREGRRYICPHVVDGAKLEELSGKISIPTTRVLFSYHKG